MSGKKWQPGAPNISQVEWRHLCMHSMHDDHINLSTHVWQKAAAWSPKCHPKGVWVMHQTHTQTPLLHLAHGNWLPPHLLDDFWGSRLPLFSRHGWRVGLSTIDCMSHMYSTVYRCCLPYQWTFGAVTTITGIQHVNHILAIIWVSI